MKVSSLFLVLVWRAVIRCRAFQPLMRLESISSPAAAASWRTIVPAERERKTARSPFGVITKFAAVMRRSSGDDEWYSPPQASTVSTSTVTLHSKALQTDVTTLEELHRHLNDPNDQRLVIVKFYASWCKTCAMLGLKMDKLALDHADRRVDSTISNSRRNEGQVRILNVEYGAARELCQQMNIARLPTIHMYMPSSSSSRSIQTTSDDRESTTTTSSNVIGRMTKVQDFSCSLKDFQRVKDLTAGYILVQQQQQQETPPMAATRIQSKSRPLEHNLRSTTTSTTPLDEEFFEATLDAGRNLIQSQLLLAALDRKKNKPPVVDPITGGIIREPSSSSSSSFSLAASSTSWRYHSTKIVEDGNDSAAVKTKRGFWSRFRKQA